MLTQLLVLWQLVQCYSDVAMVLSTTNGKLLLSMLLGCIHVLCVTIVFLSLIVLVNDVTARCEQQHVAYTVWMANNSTVAAHWG
jgi:hypothetical protein